MMEFSTNLSLVQAPGAKQPASPGCPATVSELKRARAWVPMKCWREGDAVKKRVTYDGIELSPWKTRPQRWTFAQVEGLIAQFKATAPQGIFYLGSWHLLIYRL